MTPLDSPRAHVSGLARTVVGRLAPEELPSFDAMAAPYLNGVAGTWNGRPDEPLEFGVVEAIAVITPVHGVALSRATALGVEPELAATIADAIVGALAVDPE